MLLILNYIQKVKKLLKKILKELNIEYVPPEGDFYIFPKIPNGIDELEFYEMVKKYIVIVPGSDFGVKRFYRLSYCKKLEDITYKIKQFKNVYKKVIEKLGKNNKKKKLN